MNARALPELVAAREAMVKGLIDHEIAFRLLISDGGVLEAWDDYKARQDAFTAATKAYFDLCARLGIEPH